MSLLALADVSKAYAGVPALRSVSLTIAPGEIHALMGENGAGKSTLIKILAGVVARRRGGRSPSTASRVTIDGPNAAFAHGLRFIHQELNVVPTLSVAENIFLGRALSAALRRADRLATARRAGAAGARPPRHLPYRPAPRRWRGSGSATGCWFRISAAFLDTAGAAARALCDGRADRGADRRGGASACSRSSARSAASGRSVLYVSHRLDEVMRLCDRVTVLRDGGGDRDEGRSPRPRRTRSSA